MSDILCNGLHQHGFDLKVATTTTATGNEQRPYQIIRNPSKKQLLQLHFWADLVFENNPTLNLSWPNIITRKPLIVTLHTWIARVDGQKGLQDKIKQFWLKRAKKVLACSSALAKESYPEASVIHNPYNDDLFKLNPAVTRNKKFVFLGRLVSDKGVTLAVKAFDGFLKKAADSNATLTIIGEGPEKENLQQQAQQLGIADRIIFAGTKKGEELVNLLNEHEVILIPSVWEEPFGLVALEGMACGCIPIASQSGGLSEAVGQGGLLFEKGNVDALTDCMLKLNLDEQLKHTLISNGIQHLKQHKLEYILGKYINTINQVISKR